MMYDNETYVDLRTAPEVARVVRACHGYKTEQTAKLRVFSGPMNCPSNWCGGSRSDWTLVNLTTMAILPLPQDTGGHHAQPDAPVLAALPPGFALVECTMFRGKRMPATVYVNADTMNRLALPEKPALTPDQITVLRITRGVKGGTYRTTEFGRAFASSLTLESVKVQLVALGLLTKQGGITPAGRNAISDKPSWR